MESGKNTTNAGSGGGKCCAPRGSVRASVWRPSSLWQSWSYLGTRHRLTEYDRTDGEIERLLTLNGSEPNAAVRKAPTVLGNVAAYLWQQNQLDHLTALLQRAAPLITGQYHMDQRVGTIMPQVGDDAPWPIELRYNRPLDEGRLRYEWRITAARLADTWGIPAPATLKLKRDINVPEDDLVLIVGELKTPSIEVPALPSSVAVSEEDMPEPLQPWFRAHREQWVRVDVLEEDGPWWLVPHWTQPLFVAAGHPASPKRRWWRWLSERH